MFPNHNTWLSEKFIFELEAISNSFRMDLILEKQLISPKEMVVYSLKFNIKIS